MDLILNYFICLSENYDLYYFKNYFELLNTTKSFAIIMIYTKLYISSDNFRLL